MADDIPEKPDFESLLRADFRWPTEGDAPRQNTIQSSGRGPRRTADALRLIRWWCVKGPSVLRLLPDMRNASFNPCSCTR